MQNDTTYFDDLSVGDEYQFGPYTVVREEMLAFNKKWDPLPIHTDEDAARQRGLLGVSASGQYTLCVKQHFVSRAPWAGAIIGALGFENVRFPNPVYVDDELSARVQVTHLRASKTKFDRGIVTLDFRIYNQNNTDVLTYSDVVMFQRRPGL